VMRTTAITGAEAISSADSQRIDGIRPLVTNVTFSGEATALEAARQSLEDFREAHVNLRGQINSGDLEKAILFNTSADDPGSSQETFNRFVTAIEDLRQINRDVFDQTWAAQRDALNRNQLLLGLIGYALIAALIVVGVAHRYREL